MKKGVVIGASIAIVCATATALLPEGLWTAILPMIGAIGGVGALFFSGFFEGWAGRLKAKFSTGWEEQS